MEVSFSKETDGLVEIYNILGSRVAQLASGTFNPDDTYTYIWEADNYLPEGMYLINVVTDSGSKQIKILLIK